MVDPPPPLSSPSSHLQEVGDGDRARVAPHKQVVRDGDGGAVERDAACVGREVRVVGTEHARDANGAAARRLEDDVGADGLAERQRRRRDEVGVDGPARAGVDARRRHLGEEDLPRLRLGEQEEALHVVAFHVLRDLGPDFELDVGRVDDDGARVGLHVE